jgi:hypothetical protein
MEFPIKTIHPLFSAALPFSEGDSSRLIHQAPEREDFDVRFRPDPINVPGRMREGDQKWNFHKV